MSSAEPPLPAAVGPDNSRFTLIKVLGSGSFGVVFSAVDTVTGASVAVKLERLDAKHPQLAYEHRVLRWLSPPTEGPLPAFTGFPTPLWFGESAHHAVLVESLHGPSLEDLFSWCGRTFSLKTTLTLGLQMVSRIEAAHAKQILHRDIKPDNWVLGIGPAEPGGFGTLLLLDFGLSKRYADGDGVHIPLRSNKQLTGTARFVSLRTHEGEEQSRRDDLEALIYVLAYFVRGSLPWMGLRGAATKMEKYARIHAKKAAVAPEALFAGQPPALSRLLHRVRGLGFEEVPPYEEVRGMLALAAEQGGVVLDGVCDFHQRGAPPSPRYPPQTSSSASAKLIVSPATPGTSGSGGGGGPAGGGGAGAAKRDGAAASGDRGGGSWGGGFFWGGL